MGILCVLIFLFIITMIDWSSDPYQSPKVIRSCIVFLGILFLISLVIGDILPKSPMPESHQLLAIKEGERIFYIIIQKDSHDLPNTIFVIKENDRISEKEIKDRMIINFDSAQTPIVIFHRTYVQDSLLRKWFFTHEGPVWYEFTVPSQDNVSKNL